MRRLRRVDNGLLWTLLVLLMWLSLPKAAAGSDGIKLRVCLMVEPSPFTYVSGYSNRYQALTDHLLSKNHYVEFITVDSSTGAPEEWKGSPVHYTPGIRLPFYNGLTISFDWKWTALRRIRRMKPDILHVSTPGIMGFIAALASRLWKIPLVMSYHTHLPVYIESYVVRPKWLQRALIWLSWKLLRIQHRWADILLVTSGPIQEEFQRHGMSAKVWLKGIDTERFHPRHGSGSMRHRMTDGNVDDFLLVYIGRLASEKRLTDLKPILDRLPGCRLSFVGDGPMRESLETLFMETPTTFLGQLSGRELSQAFSSADLFVMPSDSETLGFVVLESMASGVPVVASRAGGIPDLIENQRTGMLVPPGSTHDFVKAIQSVVADSSRLRSLAERARKATEEWTWEASMEHLTRVYYKDAIRIYANGQVT